MFTLNIKQNNLLSTLPKGNVRSTSKSPISSWGISPALDDHILCLSQEHFISVDPYNMQPL